MANSILELAAQNLKTTLDGVSVANNYLFTPLVRRIGTQKAPTSKTIAADGTPYAIEIEIQQPSIEASPVSSFGKSTYFMAFHLVCFVEQSSASTTPTDAINTEIYAELTRALMADATRGGYAVDTTVGDLTVFVNAQGGYEGVGIDVLLEVRTSQFDLYNP